MCLCPRSNRFGSCLMDVWRHHVDPLSPFTACVLQLYHRIFGGWARLGLIQRSWDKPGRGIQKENTKISYQNVWRGENLLRLTLQALPVEVSKINTWSRLVGLSQIIEYVLQLACIHFPNNQTKSIELRVNRDSTIHSWRELGSYISCGTCSIFVSRVCLRDTLKTQRGLTIVMSLCCQSPSVYCRPTS